MANNKHFTPERVEIQINRALETEREDFLANSEDRLVQRVNAHFQPGNEYDLALKRIRQRLAYIQAEGSRVERVEEIPEKQERLEPSEPFLPEQFRPGQFQRASAGKARGLLRPLSLLAAAALCILLVSGALTLLSQAHKVPQCKSCLAGHIPTPPAQKVVQQYYELTIMPLDPAREILYRFDPITGATLWQFAMPAERLGQGVWTYAGTREVQVLNGVLYFLSTGSDGLYVYALHTSNGLLVWKYKYATGYSYATKTILANGKIYIVSNNSSSGRATVLALDIRTGQPAWQRAYNNDAHLNSPGSFWHAMAAVAVAGNILLVIQPQNTDHQHGWNLYGLNALTGDQLWVQHFLTTMDEEPISWQLQGNVLYLGTETYTTQLPSPSHLYAIEATTGQTIWAKTLPGPIQVQIAQHTIYVIGNVFMTTSTIYALNSSDGSIIWHKDLFVGGQALLLANGEVYALVVSNEHPWLLVALRGDNGREVWQSSGNAQLKYLSLGAVDEHYLYLGVASSNKIAVFDRKTGTFVKTITLKGKSEKDQGDTIVFSVMAS